MTRLRGVFALGGLPFQLRHHYTEISTHHHRTLAQLQQAQIAPVTSDTSLSCLVFAQYQGSRHDCVHHAI